MSTKDLVKVVKERGLSLVLKDDGNPYVRGPEDARTPALVTVLKLHRERIIDLLKRGEL